MSLARRRNRYSYLVSVDTEGREQKKRLNSERREETEANYPLQTKLFVLFIASIMRLAILRRGRPEMKSRAKVFLVKQPMAERVELS